jgi:hypothetical protein
MHELCGEAGSRRVHPLPQFPRDLRLVGQHIHDAGVEPRLEQR